MPPVVEPSLASVHRAWLGRLTRTGLPAAWLAACQSAAGAEAAQILSLLRAARLDGPCARTLQRPLHRFQKLL